MEIKLHDALSPGHAHAILNQAFAAIEKVQQLMSFHDPQSDLSRLNQYAFYQAVQVDPVTYAVLQRAQRLFNASHGLFDCSIANTLVNWKILPDHLLQNHLQQNHLPQDHLDKTIYSQINLKLLNDHFVQFSQPILLDLGGIAKGFAVDLAIHCLRKNGIKNAVVNAGGDLRVLGQIAEEIVIRDPQNLQNFHRLGALANGALATSASYFSKTENGNALVNPFNRQALDSEHSFSVIAPTAYVADALTKVMAISQNPQHPCLKIFAAQAVIF